MLESAPQINQHSCLFSSSPGSCRTRFWQPFWVSCYLFPSKFYHSDSFWIFYRIHLYKNNQINNWLNKKKAKYQKSTRISWSVTYLYIRSNTSAYHYTTCPCHWPDWCAKLSFWNNLQWRTVYSDRCFHLRVGFRMSLERIFRPCPVKR